MQFEGTRMYRVGEVARHFGVSAATIYRAIESGQLVALKLGEGKGTLRVPVEAVEEYARSCVIDATPGPCADAPASRATEAGSAELLAGGAR